MRQHTHLPAMVGFVRKHVAQHFRPNRPRPGPAVSQKFLDSASITAERFRQHVRAASGALRQCRAGPLRRTIRAVELPWDLQVRSCKPHPLAADIVHVREDGRNGADLAGRFGIPGSRIEMSDKHLVQALIGGKNLECGPAELTVNLGLTRGHASLIPRPMILPASIAKLNLLAAGNVRSHRGHNHLIKSLYYFASLDPLKRYGERGRNRTFNPLIFDQQPTNQWFQRFSKHFREHK